MTSGDSASVPQAGAERAVDPRPLAAYRLGFGVQFWHEAFWLLRDDESTWGNVPLAVAQLRAARIDLAVEIPPNVFGELGRVIDEIDRMTGGLIEALRSGGAYANVNFDSSHSPGNELWKDLRALSNLALGSDHELRSLYDLGVALGEFRLK